MRFIITGQVHGGKNHINITRTGHRYPSPLFAEWCNKVIAELLPQKPVGFMVTTPSRFWTFKYTPADKRRRDAPAVLDACFHVFEKAGIVADDSLVKDFRYTELEPSKAKAGMIVEVV